MRNLIDTPYGRKTPELLCKAMDAHTAIPEIIKTLEALRSCLTRDRDANEDRACRELIKQLHALI